MAKGLFATAMIAVHVACGTPKSQAPPIMVAFSPGFVPPASLNTGAYARVAATVTNDPANAGVTFGCLPAGNCGSFTPPAAGSTVAVCYLAPDNVPSGNTVTVTAASDSDPTRFVSATITIVNTGAPNPCP